MAISSTFDKSDGWATSYKCESTQESLHQKIPFTQILFLHGSVKSHLLHCFLESLSLKMLSLKLVVLLALTRLSRSNDLSNLSLKAMRVLRHGVQFNPYCLSKQSHPFRPLNPFTFPSFSSGKRLLCPKEALQAYAAKTEFVTGRIGFPFHMSSLTVQYHYLWWPDE